jgi:hypothetical protein
MATSAVTFYSSSNGDRWQLITNAETGHHVVREEHLVTFVEIAFISIRALEDGVQPAVAAQPYKRRRKEDQGRQDPCRRGQIRLSPGLGIDVSPANRHDTKAIVPVLRQLADGGFQGTALGDLGYRGERLAKAGEALGITVAAIPSSRYSTGCAGGTLASLARGRGGRFVPAGICWAEHTHSRARSPKVPRALARGMAVEGVERSFAWLSCYRRLNTIFERTKDHLVAFVEIAFISILSRRLNRLVANELRA